MTKLELEMLNSVPSTEFNTFWIPCTWFINLLREAKQECRITDSNGLKLIMEEFNEFRSKCGLLWSYDWISIPLVYTQVVTLATYAFFGACIFGRQYVESPDKADRNFELYIPVFTIFQLFFYMGLLKVAEQLINPFGDDDEDFELNWIIDRHIKVSYLGVDILNTRPPPLVRDSYFYEEDMKLPYTEASVGYKKKTYRGSVARMQIPQEKQNLLVPEFSEDDDEDKIAATYGMGNRGASLWTLVGGKLNTRFSVSNQNLDTVTLESGSNNWKVSNPSLFIPANGFEAPAPGSNVGATQHLQVPEEGAAEAEAAQNVNPQYHRQRRSSEIPKKAFKVVKKVVVPLKKPLKRRGAHPHNRWVSFHSSAGKNDDNEVLSLYRGDGAHDVEYPSSDRRRSSFVGSIGASSYKEETASRFQSAPDFKTLVRDRGAEEIWEGEVPPESQDNLSTANLLILYEEAGGDDETRSVLFEPPPELTFTGASPAPSTANSLNEDNVPKVTDMAKERDLEGSAKEDKDGAKNT